MSDAKGKHSPVPRLGLLASDPKAQARHTEAWAKGRRAAELEYEGKRWTDADLVALAEHLTDWHAKDATREIKTWIETQTMVSYSGPLDGR